MRVYSPRSLLLLAVALIPLSVSAQESTHFFSVSQAAFSDLTLPPMSLTPPQSSGEKSVALAVVLNGLIFPGVGNFYAGNSGHGLRHVGLALGGGVVFALGAVDALEYGSDGEGDALLIVGGVIIVGNWVWSIVSGIEDARAAGRPAAAIGGTASTIQSRLVPLGVSTALGDPLTTPRLGLQLVRIVF